MKELDYFNGDDLAASVWKGKYALKNEKGEYVEETPKYMHRRMAKELARIEQKYGESSVNEWNRLSHFGRHLDITNEDLIFSYFDRFKYIVPQGSIMSALGNFYKIQSLSNCFVIPPPYDSYAGIFKTDQEIAQLEKRRGGVGTNLNTLRPDDTPVLNAAGTSTGAHSFMDRYSNTTREVAQNGRRGALMLLMSCLHPDIFKFVGKKKDRTKVTGANISVQLTDEFMEAVKDDADFICRFPTDWDCSNEELYASDYNVLSAFHDYDGSKKYYMRIKARELFNEIVLNAWENAEPGLAFMDTVIGYSPEGVYEQFRPIASNPCGEQWMQAYDACRLLALNLFSIVKNPFTPEAEVDFEKLYEIAYIQQRLADDIVDLEIEYVQRIIDKIKSDPEPEEVKATELNLWINVQNTAKASRRTGCGITALGDMLAALGLKYDSEEALKVTEQVMKKKMEAELDCTIDLAILRGTFEGWDISLEFTDYNDSIEGNNDFYRMLLKEFPFQCERMHHYGRRNVSWSTVAPTGSVSILTQTTSGLEPLFLPFYMRRKKVNPSDKGVRVDFVDQNGDSWQEFPVLHPKFKDWVLANWTKVIVTQEFVDVNNLSKEALQKFFELSPWYKACANDISWEKRVDIQAVIQKYTTNAISSTMNLPNDVTKETVAGIYMESWKRGLKGITIYRDGCRTGVLVSETKVQTNEFGYSDAPKRPKELEAQLHVVSVKGQKYGVVVGMLNDNPYEVFAFPANEDLKSVKGAIFKVKKGQYDFVSEDGEISNLQSQALHAEEQVLTRLVSGMLRHGMNPYFIIDQINKTPLEVVSFGKALTRILKQYIKDDEIKGKAKCSDCGSENVRLQEGCLTCNSCGSSKCG
jgi:ribonucleoside-diphosphate reductase alpha chain